MCKALDSITKLEDVVNEIKEQNLYFEERIRELDFQISDLIHKIEFEEMTDTQCVECIGNIRAIRKERRKLKKEQETMNIVVDYVNNYADIKTTDINGVKMQIEYKKNGQEMKSYRPRTEMWYKQEVKK